MSRFANLGNHTDLLRDLLNERKEANNDALNHCSEDDREDLIQENEEIDAILEIIMN